MRILKISSVIMMAGLIVACSSSSQRPERTPRGGFERANMAFNTGDFATAHEGYSCIASRGHGFEVAQHNAGLASMEMSRDPSLTDEEAQLLRGRGLGELMLAANAGWPASQAELSEYYFERGDDDGVVRAGYWLLMYSGNNRETALGLQRLSNARQDEIFTGVGEERMLLAQQSLQNYRLTPLEASRPETYCAPWFEVRGPRRPQRRRAPDIAPDRAPSQGQPRY